MVLSWLSNDGTIDGTIMVYIPEDAYDDDSDSDDVVVIVVVIYKESKRK